MHPLKRSHQVVHHHELIAREEHRELGIDDIAMQVGNGIHRRHAELQPRRRWIPWRQEVFAVGGAGSERKPARGGDQQPPWHQAMHEFFAHRCHSGSNA
jgi:hypothetical protein